MLLCGVEKFMLSIQYRMHPDIKEFPSQKFYDGMLTDDISIRARVNNSAVYPGILQNIEQKMNHFMFLDTVYAREEANETSKSNKDEAMFILQIFENMIREIASAE